MPNRVLRDWTTSEPIENLSFEAEVFFTRLIMKADDHGNYHANVKLLRSALFPLRDSVTNGDIAKWLSECVRVGIVVFYKAEGKDYINIPNFGQRLRQMRSTFPQPADNPLTSGGQLTDNGRPETETETETKRNETETKEKTRAWFESCIDEIYRGNLAMTHKGKNVDQAIAEAWTHLSADPQRLRIIDSGGAKKLVNTWLGNMKAAKEPKKPSFNLKDI